jgi:primosomal protein N' (replication factor Y)
LVDAIDRHLRADGQVLIYLNRRGFAPVLMCSACGQVTECRRCDARMVYHLRRALVVCHHCGSERPAPECCEHCGESLTPVGQGTERLEAALRQRFPDYPLVRIDRDTTRRRGEIERRLELVRSGEARLLLGTQMLTKGHDFPNVTLVGVVDADQGLFGTDFRSSERMAQSFVQVSGRAGRAERPGEVLIQTLFPDHPLLQRLVRDGYHAFALDALAARRESHWPPFAYLALLRAEAARRETVFEFLDEARAASVDALPAGVELLGPAPAPMERRAGRYRGQLLLRSEQRAGLQRFLAGWRAALEPLRSARRVRWSLDVDPAELF